MRVAILTHSYPAKSSERQYAANFILSFAQILADKIEKVFVFAPDYGGEKENYQKAPVFWLPLAGKKKKLGYLKPWDPRDLLQFIKFFKTGNDLIPEIIKQNEIDFCLVFWVFPSGLFALKIKKNLGIPYGVWALGSDLYLYPQYLVLRQVIQKILREADLCFGHGEYMCDEVKNLSGSPCYFLPALSTLSFEKKKKRALDKKRFNFIFLGRLEKIKGVELLLEAVIDLAKETKNFNLYILGDGLLRQDLEKKVAQANLRLNVFFLGNVDEEKILAGYYLGADAIVIPSRVECLPLVFTEAIRARLPVIASNVGDMGSLIKKNNLGLTFTKEKRISLLKALKQALKEGKRFKTQRRKNLQMMAKQFTAEAVVDQFLGYLKKKNLFS